MPSVFSRSTKRNKYVDDTQNHDGMIEFSISSEESYEMKNKNRFAEAEGALIADAEGCVANIRAMAGIIVHNKHFQNFIVFLIVVNAVMMGASTFSAIKDNEEIFWAFEWTDQAFLIAFTLELMIQFTYHGHRLFFDGWLVFDFVIVVLSWALQSLQIIRAFRIFRALRLVTRVRSLRALISAIFSVLPRMFGMMCVTGILFYIYDVMFTTLYRSLPLGDMFGSLEFTALTLFQLMTMEEWSVITRDVMDQKPLYGLPLVSFILISSFIVYNLVVAIVCDSMNVLRDHIEKEEEGDDQFIARKEFAKISAQVVDLQKYQAGIQEKLDLLTILVRDAGGFNVHRKQSRASTEQRLESTTRHVHAARARRQRRGGPGPRTSRRRKTTTTTRAPLPTLSEGNVLDARTLLDHHSEL